MPMTQIVEKRLTGERALFMAQDVHIKNCLFADGESPLKESHSLLIENSSFQWKYPLWYSSNIKVTGCTFFAMARAGIWYTKDISLEDCLYEAPKGFRRVEGLFVKGVNFPQAQETLWNCSDVSLENVSVHGDYFAMNCTNLQAKNLNLSGNYSFDGCKNVKVQNAKLISKDAFWNCDNVTVEDSFISGEYVGWNSKNVTFENCTIESLQGFCYMQNVVLKNCRLLNTTLAFEYSTVDAECTTSIDSVKNPKGGSIKCKGIGDLIFDDKDINPADTKIIC